MDLQKIITSLFIGVGILTLNANRTGVPQAVTGAPGESGFSCNACHNGGNFNTNIGLKIMETDSNVVSQYTPGEEYILEIDVNGQNNPKSFGFQLVALDSMQNDMSQWKLTGDQVRQINLLNRRYLVQSSAKASGKFYVNWTAPSDYNGHVEFYYSGLAVNLNGNTSGDSHATGKRSFPSDAISSISSTLP